MMKSILIRLLQIAITCGLISLLAMFSKHYVFFDILSHFRLQYLAGLVPALLVAIFYKQLKSIALISFIVAVHLYVVVVGHLDFSNDRETSRDSIELRVMNSNLLLVNTEYQQNINFINEINPDVIAFQEYTFGWDNALQSGLDNYPHRSLFPINSPFGIAVYSKHPIVSGGPVNYSTDTPKTIDVMLNIDGQEVRLIAVHPVPAASNELLKRRDKFFNLLAQQTSSQNISHAGRGKHWYGSWPSGFWPLRIPIDHVMTNQHISVKTLRAEPIAASDHLSIIADVVVDKP